MTETAAVVDSADAGRLRVELTDALLAKQRVALLTVIPRGLVPCADQFSRTEPDGATRCGGLLDHDGHASAQHAVGVI